MTRPCSTSAARMRAPQCFLRLTLPPPGAPSLSGCDACGRRGSTARAVKEGRESAAPARESPGRLYAHLEATQYAHLEPPGSRLHRRTPNLNIGTGAPTWDICSRGLGLRVEG